MHGEGSLADASHPTDCMDAHHPARTRELSVFRAVFRVHHAVAMVALNQD